MTSGWPSSVRPPHRRSRRGARPRPLDPRSQDHGTFSRCSGIERRRSRSRMRGPSWLMSSATPSATRKTAGWSDPGRERQVVLGRLGLADLLDLAVFGLAGWPARPTTIRISGSAPFHRALSSCRRQLRFGGRYVTADTRSRAAKLPALKFVDVRNPPPSEHGRPQRSGRPRSPPALTPSPQPTGWNAAPAAPLAPEPAPP